MGPPRQRDIVDRIKRRHDELGSLLGDCDDSVIAGPSKLPGWSRLTVLCHLRYGAEASVRMTHDIVEGRPTAFYPGGPEQRPETLAPRPGETSRDVVTSLVEGSASLDRLWAGLDGSAWQLSLDEPGGNQDLGSITLDRLALLRLTEIEVHGTDLDIGAEDWSDVFVRAALPMRLSWLSQRRSRPQVADHSVTGMWVFATDEGEIFSVEATQSGVSVRNEDTVGERAARLAGTRRDLLGFLMGRVALETLHISGDESLARRFHQAFPPP